MPQKSAVLLHHPIYPKPNLCPRPVMRSSNTEPISHRREQSWEINSKKNLKKLYLGGVSRHKIKFSPNPLRIGGLGWFGFIRFSLVEYDPLGLGLECGVLTTAGLGKSSSRIHDRDI